MHKSIFILTAVAAFIPFQPVSAETEDNIIVTANRTETPANRVIVPVNVIDRQTIERNVALDLSDILRFQADLDIVRTGGPGQQTSIFTRGTESNHTLVMIDGVKVNNGSVGTAPIEFISPDFIERIEVVKAPRTSLYGEDAIGGVINILTKDTDGPAFNAFGGGGSDSTIKAGAGGGTSFGNFNIGGQIQHTDTDGFPTVAGTDEDRGYDNTTAVAKLTGKIDRWEIESRFWRSEGTSEYITFPTTPVDQDYTNQAIAFGLGSQFLENWHSKIDVSQVKDDLEQNQSTDFVETERVTTDWQNTIQLNPNHTLVGGLYYSSEDVDASGFSPVSENTTVKAVYLEDNFYSGPHSVVVAGRYSDHEAFDGDFTWNLEYGFKVSDPLRLTASAGRAVRAPTAFDRFGFSGNPDLDEEEALTVQAGAQWKITSRQNAGINFFYSEIDNLITFNFDFSSLENIDETEIKGVEANYSYSGDNWYFNAAGLLQSPEDKDTGDTLARRREESFTASLTRYFGPHSASIDFLAVGSREDFGGDMAGYALTNLTGQFFATERWSFNARLENVFDRDYVVANYDFGVPYNTPDRSVFAEVRYNWKP